jgi:hypothetical protein
MRFAIVYLEAQLAPTAVEERAAGLSPLRT